MADPSLSEQLSRHLTALQFDQLPSEVIESAKLHILDSLGCLLAGARLEPGRLAYDLALASGRGPSESVTLIGTERRISSSEAVQAMAAAAHCGELDDIHGGAGVCVGAMVVPALLAMIEERGGTGRRFLESVVVGYETMVRVGLSIDAPKLFARGWWPSTICGAFGVAAAGAKFLGWTEKKIANVLGVASLLSGGMLTGGNEGATARHLAFGRAAQNGIVALLAAEQGLTGPRFAFEDARGFGPTLCAAPCWEFLQTLETYFLPEVAFKPYPCARQLHAAVEALLKLKERHAIAPSAIAAINLAMPSPNAAMTNRPATPHLRAATLGSGQYVMAVTALRGIIDLQSFEEEFLRSERVHQLMAKVTIASDSELDSYFPKYWAGRVTVKLENGQAHTEQILAPKGEPENPMTPREVEQKFTQLAVPVIGDSRVAEIIQLVASLEALPSFTELFEALTPSGATRAV